jgi:hypothetical protein
MNDYPEFTEHPWPAYTKPTAAERLPWFLEQNTDAQVWMIERWEEDSRVATKCQIHDAHEQELERLRAQLERARTEIRWLTEARKTALAS